MYYKGSVSNQWGKMAHSINQFRRTGWPRSRGGGTLALYFTFYFRRNSKRLKYLDIKSESTKVLTENMGEGVNKLGVGGTFLSLTAR